MTNERIDHVTETRERLIDVLVMTDLSDYAGTDMGMINAAADAILAAFPVLSRAAAPEPEWEYGYTSKWGICRRGNNVVAAEQDASTLRRSIEMGRESGDLEHHGKVMRRARLAPGPWEPLPVGGENDEARDR